MYLELNFMSPNLQSGNVTDAAFCKTFENLGSPDAPTVGTCDCGSPLTEHPNVSNLIHTLINLVLFLQNI